MADYQSVLTRAVAKLPGASSADMRRAIYDRAREAMLTHLRGLHPRLLERDITREEIALNQAIALVEAKFDAAEAGPAKPTAAKPAPPAAGYPDRIEAGASPRPAQLGQPSNLKSVPSSLAESAPAAPLLRGPATAPPSPVLQHLPPARPPSASSNLAKVVPPANAHASRSLAVALSIVLSLAGAAIVMRQNPQDRVIALLQHGREISPEPSAKITQHAQLSPTVANEPQGSQSIARSGETSQPAPQPDRPIAPVANESQGSQSIARSGETSQPAPQPDGSTAPVANEPQGSQSIARSRETSQPAPQADGSTAPVANESQGSQSIARSGETSQPAPQADGSTAPVASELQGSQSIARSGETSQPAPQADSGTLPEAARAAMVIASQDKPQAPPDPPAPAATLASEAAPVDAPQRPAEAAPKVEGKVVVGAQPRTPNLHRIAKLSRRLTVAKTAATAPNARAETPRQPQRPGALTTPQAPIEPHTIAAPAAAQEPVNPMAHVLGTRTGVLAPSAVEQTATKSGDWAIQFAKPKSEVEAAVAAARLNAKYAPALNGATIGIRKTQVNGETIYALRVAGLSKADAIALCVRVKGRDCSIIK
jgi:SPOR domain